MLVKRIESYITDQPNFSILSIPSLLHVIDYIRIFYPYAKCTPISPPLLDNEEDTETITMPQRFPFNPLWGSLLLTFVALLIGGNAASPFWLRILLFIGLSLYNTLWWLVQAPDYSVFHKPTMTPDEQREMARLKRSTFRSRLFSACLLTVMSIVLLFVFLAEPSDAGAQSWGVYGGALLVTLLLGVLLEGRRYSAS